MQLRTQFFSLLDELTKQHVTLHLGTLHSVEEWTTVASGWLVELPGVSGPHGLEQVFGTRLRIWEILGLGSHPHLYHLTASLVTPQFEH